MSSLDTPSELNESCAQCEFDGNVYDATSLLTEIASLGPRWRELLRNAGSDAATRPEIATWSAIEYAAHSRDITSLHVYGVQQALTGLEPDFGDIEGDELIATAAVDYGESDPEIVLDELSSAASLLADVARAAPLDHWKYGITVGGVRSDVRRLLEHAYHDSYHHLDDVRRGLRIIHTSS